MSHQFQSEFSIFRRIQTDETVRRFVEVLDQNQDWITASAVARILDLGERGIRALAEAAAPDIISGQKGYKHVRHATPEEVNRFVSWMESQGKKMIHRAEAVRRHAHKLVG